MEVQQQEEQNKINQSINEIETTAPGKLRVIKRNGKVVAFEDDKIKVAITKYKNSVKQKKFPSKKNSY